MGSFFLFFTSLGDLWRLVRRSGEALLVLGILLEEVIHEALDRLTGAVTNPGGTIWEMTCVLPREMVISYHPETQKRNNT